ncbi:4-hydroxy-3-methylbut-2-en-1-yl diphosphate synthase, partial [bacterium]|nr:4-hydroxy-3-methylbut-2-en-1-yl diphosphate synthase [bacterium]
HANIGISFPGSSEKPGIPVYQDGQLTHTLRGDKAEDAFFELLETYVSQRYQPCSG